MAKPKLASGVKSVGRKALPHSGSLAITVRTRGAFDNSHNWYNWDKAHGCIVSFNCDKCGLPMRYCSCREGYC